LPSLATWQWTLGGACAFFVGVAKTGVPGLGILVVPVMVLAIGDARQAAGWLLPVLCTADVFAVIAWRRHAAAKKLFDLAPWVLAGMALGAWALGFSERTLRPVVGIIVLAMLAVYLWRRLSASYGLLSSHPALYGATAGFATTVANAAGPVMNLYLLSKRLPKEEFIATGAWFFFLINLAKLPIYIWHGLITPESLAADAVFAPAVVAGAATGRWLVRHIPNRAFEALVAFLTGISTFLLFR